MAGAFFSDRSVRRALLNVDKKGQAVLWAFMWEHKQNGARGPVLTCFLAERAGFEPAVGITPRTLSRRVT